MLEIHHVAGEDCFLLKVRAKDAEHLGQMLRRQIAAVPGVTSTRTTIVLETVKETSRIPIVRKSAADVMTSAARLHRLDHRLRRLGHDVSRAFAWRSNRCPSRCSPVCAGRPPARCSPRSLPLVGERFRHPRTWGSIAVAGFLMAVIGNGGVVWAEQYVASGLAAVIVAMVPFWSVLVEALFRAASESTRAPLVGLARRLPRHRRARVARADHSADRKGGCSSYGVICAADRLLGWALGTSYTKRNAQNAVPLARGGDADAAERRHADRDRHRGWVSGTGSSFTPRTAGAMIYLVLIGSIVGYSAYVYALKYLPISTVSLYAYVNPIIAVVLGTLLLDEPFTCASSLARRWSCRGSPSSGRRRRAAAGRCRRRRKAA